MELRNSALDIIKSKFPNMPRYVLIDFVYKNYKNDMESLDELVEKFKNVQWKQEAITITPDIFEPQTAERLQQRKGGASSSFKVSNDEDRHSTQKQLVAQAPSTEPIIIISTPQGYELVEGWHRTIQSLENWPEGYKQNAWIGYEHAPVFS